MEINMLGTKKAKSLDKIVSGFSKVTAELETLINQNKREVEANEETIKSMQAINDALNEEAKSADTIMTNIQVLLGAQNSK